MTLETPETIRPLGTAGTLRTPGTLGTAVTLGTPGILGTAGKTWSKMCLPGVFAALNRIKNEFNNCYI